MKLGNACPKVRGHIHSSFELIKFPSPYVVEQVVTGVGSKMCGSREGTLGGSREESEVSGEKTGWGEGAGGEEEGISGRGRGRSRREGQKGGKPA